jgi:hypothetical protein
LRQDADELGVRVWRCIIVAAGVQHEGEAAHAPPLVCP